MGWISSRCQMTGSNLNPSPEKQRKGPLRKIVGVLNPSDGIFEPSSVRLECGHTAKAWGSERARCSKCAEGKPADPLWVTEK